jgi:polysaccharide biosynthesis protein PslH
MRILVVTPFVPAPPNFGGAARIYYLAREMRRHADVTLFALAGPDDDVTLLNGQFDRVIAVPAPMTAREPASPAKRREQIGSVLSGQSFQRRFYWKPEAQRALDRLLAEGTFDIVQLEFGQMGAYQTPDGVKRVIDNHNVEHDTLRQIARSGSWSKRLFNGIEWRKFQREEQRYWREADLNLATSDLDARAIEEATGRAPAVIRNGVDDRYFQREPLRVGGPPSVIFTGAMRYQPNADAAVYFVQRVWPFVHDQIPEATFTIVGADPPPDVLRLGEIDGVQVTGSVDDVRPWMKRSAAVVVPLLTGGGTRLKILEAFAVGRPVVSTSIGAAGLEVVEGTHLLIADRAFDMAVALVSLLRNQGQAGRLAEAAHALVQERYRWSGIADDLSLRYDQLLAVE